jgi:hypothetical protein
MRYRVTISSPHHNWLTHQTDVEADLPSDAMGEALTDFLQKRREHGVLAVPPSLTVSFEERRT